MFPTLRLDVCLRVHDPCPHMATQEQRSELARLPAPLSHTPMRTEPGQGAGKGASHLAERRHGHGGISIRVFARRRIMRGAVYARM